MKGTNFSFAEAPNVMNHTCDHKEAIGLGNRDDVAMNEAQ